MSRPPPVLLMTRPEPDSRAFAGTLQGAFDLVISPLFRVEPAKILPTLPGNCGIIFTSANGVHAWLALSGPICDPCFAVGEATARAARVAGFRPISANGSAAELIAMIRRNAPTVPLVHARGAYTRGDVAKSLVSAGIETHEAFVYTQTAMPLIAKAQVVLAGARPVIVPIFSPRTAQLFQKQAIIRAPIAIAAMSNAVADTFDGTNFRRIEIAEQPTAQFMRISVQRLLDADRWVEGREDPQ